jgi:hypothetical protein
MSSNNSVRAIIGLAVVILIGCVQFEGSFGELRGPQTSRTVNSSSPGFNEIILSLQEFKRSLG